MTRHRYGLRTCATLVAGLLTTGALADEVRLRDGSVLQGEIIRQSEDELVLTTAFAGEITVAADQVVGLTTDEPRVVALASGDRLVGRLEHDEGAQRVRSDSLGRLPVDVDRIEALWAVDAPSPAELAREEQVADLEERLDALADPWTASIAAGANGSSGTADRFAANARAEAERETRRDRLELYIDGAYAEEDANQTENEIKGGTLLEHDLGERVFTFGQIELERDEFEELELRAVTSGGLGYFLVRRPEHRLRTRLGIGYEHEAFDSGETNGEGLFSLGYDFRTRFRNWFGFEHELTWFPGLTAPLDEYRLDSRAAFELPAEGAGPWAIRLGLQNQYDPQAVEGVGELDTTWFLNLAYEFD